MICKIFQKKSLRPSNGDRYAPFIEEEWEEDGPVVIPGADVEDGVANGDEVREGCTNIELVLHLLINFIEIYVFESH